MIDELKCMHDWGWSVVHGALKISCKEEECKYYSEDVEDGMNLITFRELMFTAGINHEKVKK